MPNPSHPAPHPQGLALKIPPLLLLALCSIAMVCTPAIGTWSVPWPLRVALVCALGLTGLAVCGAGVLAFRRMHTTVNPMDPASSTSLVVCGIYRYSRNPMYLGFALLLLALAVWCQHVLGFLWVAAFVAYVQRYQIRPEEAALYTLFGASYARYCQQVRRWL